MKKNASYKIAWMTFIANIFILLEHANLGGSDLNNPIGITMNVCSEMATPMMGWFFFCTSYLFFRNINFFQEIFERLKKRYYTLFIPYVIWNTIGGVLHFLGGDFTGNMSPLYIFRHTYLFYDGVGCGDGPLWYVARLFSYLLLAPIIYSLLKKRSVVLFSLVELSLIILNVLAKTNNYHVLFFFPIFLIGAYIGINSSRELEDFLDNNKANYTLVLLLGLVLVLCTWTRNLINIPAIPIIYRIVAVALIIYALRNLGRVPAPNVFVSSAGMYLYCAHDLVYRVVRVIVFKLGNNATQNQLMLVILSAVILVSSWAFMNRFFPKLLNLLSGGRNSRKISVE